MNPWTFRPDIGLPNIRAKLLENPANIMIAGRNDLLIRFAVTYVTRDVHRPRAPVLRVGRVQHARSEEGARAFAYAYAGSSRPENSNWISSRAHVSGPAAGD